MGFSEIIESVSDGEIEEIYDTIRGNRPHERGVEILEKIKAIMYTFRSQFMSMNNDPTMHRTFVSLYKKLESQVFELERHMRLEQDNLALMQKDEALKIASNLHLLLNSLRSFGRDMDKRT